MSSNTELEQELSFLANFMPSEIETVSPVRLKDSFLDISNDTVVFRLRQKGDSYVITKKSQVEGTGGTTCIEETISLTNDEFDYFVQAPGVRSVEKDRYTVDIQGRKADVDIFRGGLSGLVLIEFEFDTLGDMKSFSKPNCCGSNVSNEVRLAGFSLAGKSYDDLKSVLTDHKYEKIESKE